MESSEDKEAGEHGKLGKMMDTSELMFGFLPETKDSVLKTLGVQRNVKGVLAVML